MKLKILFFYLFVCLALLSAETVFINTIETPSSLDGLWETATGTSDKNSLWQTVDFPSVSYTFPEEETRTYFFKRFFSIDSALHEKNIGLFLGRLPDATEVYINGCLVLKAGISPPEGYYGDIFRANSLIVPDALINFNEMNEILLKVYTEKPATALPSIYFCNNATRSRAINRSRLLNQYLGAIASSMAFLTSLYFFVLYLLNKKEKINLYLFLGALGFSINVSSLFIISKNLSFLGMYKVQNIGLYLGVNCVILFIQNYMKRHQGKGLRRFFLSATVLMSLAIAVMPDFRSAIFLNDTIFYMFYIAPALFYMLYLSVRGFIDKIYFSSVLLTGVVLALAGGIRDIGMILAGRTPEFFTNTVGMVCMVVCIFISYAARFNRSKKLSEIARLELEVKNKNIALINTSLERFIPNEVLSYLDKNNIIEIDLGDHAEEMMTVMFTDIRDFTSLSEAMNPEENFRFINSYLNRMGPVIRKHQGFVDKYLGDGIMALFPCKPEDAVNAALEMRSELDVYNSHRANCGYNPISIGIGLHYGMLMIGTIGEEKRMDSTVISDTVNIAARLEGLTKDLNADILISHELRSQVGRFPYTIEFLGNREVKGKAEPLAVYSIKN